MMYIHKVKLKYDRNRLVKRDETDMLVIHHTGNGEDDDLGAQDLNYIHRGMGWTCIGYHFVIRKDGRVEEGRALEAIGAHAEGENYHTIGIHVSGNFEIAEPTKEQIESTAMLVAYLCTLYNLPINRKTVLGHRELMATLCPGIHLYNKLNEISGKANYYKAQGGI